MATQLSAAGGVDGILFSYTMPTGASGAYTPTKADAQILDANISESLSAAPNTTINVSGYLNFGTTFKLLTLTGAAAKATSVRLYSAVIDTGAPAASENCILKFNVQDANNGWEVTVHLSADAGNPHKVFIGERVAGVLTQKASGTLPTQVDTPALLLLEVYDFGNRVTAVLSGYETDLVTDFASVAATFFIDNRSFKNETGFAFGSWVGTTYSFRSINVIDLDTFTLWTPAEISTALWLDADDASTITTVSGKVSQWSDKSGNARHATQADSAKRPVVTAAGIGGLDVIDFAGAEVHMDVPRGFITSAISAFYVTAAASAINQKVLSQTPQTAAKGWFVRTRPNPPGVSFIVRNDASNSRGANIDVEPGAGAYQTGALFPVGGDADAYINGTLQADTGLGDAAAAPTDIDNTGLPIRIAMNADGDLTQKFDGRIAEIVLLASAADTTTRQLIEGYLAHKWGLTAGLPGGHPYKNDPPLV